MISIEHLHRFIYIWLCGLVQYRIFATENKLQHFESVKLFILNPLYPQRTTLVYHVVRVFRILRQIRKLFCMCVVITIIISVIYPSSVISVICAYFCLCVTVCCVCVCVCVRVCVHACVRARVCVVIATV